MRPNFVTNLFMPRMKKPFAEDCCPDEGNSNTPLEERELAKLDEIFLVLLEIVLFYPFVRVLGQLFQLFLRVDRL